MSVNEKMTAIADAIRAKTGGTDPLSLDAMALEIDGISAGTEFAIAVTVDSGSVVTATKGETTVSGTAVDGVCVLTVPEAGEWVVSATLDGTETNDVIASVKDFYEISLQFIPAVGTALNDIIWDHIRKISSMGLAPSYFAIGDVKATTLNGKLGTLSLSNYKGFSFIIGFNHNAELEGANLTHFQIGKSALSNGKDVALCDSKYGSTVSAQGYFSMQTSNDNTTGWAGSQLRTVICGTSLDSYAGTFIDVIPAELRAVLAPVTKYTYNSGAVTATVDYSFVLSEFELFGSVTYGMTEEKGKQVQYEYYSAGNSKVKYKQDVTTYVNYLLRSRHKANMYNYVRAATDGKVTNGAATYSGGFSPCFCVGGAAA